MPDLIVFEYLVKTVQPLDSTDGQTHNTLNTHTLHTSLHTYTYITHHKLEDINFHYRGQKPKFNISQQKYSQLCRYIHDDV